MTRKDENRQIKFEKKINHVQHFETITSKRDGSNFSGKKSAYLSTFLSKEKESKSAKLIQKSRP